VTVYLDGVEYDGVSEVTDGTHVLKVVAVDEMGHRSEKQVSFLIDSKAPVILVSPVEDGDTLSAATVVTVSVQLSEDTLSDVQLNGKAVEIEENEARFTVNRKGEYKLIASAYDEAGNKASVEMDFTYRGRFNWIPIIVGCGLIMLLLIILGILRRRHDEAA